MKRRDPRALASTHTMEVVHKNVASLEQRVRLSRSVIWRLQRDYFERQGIEAWSTGTVPHHITSSPFIADAYARIVSGYLRDCLFTARRRKNSSLASLDPSQPVYVVELGAGPGRLGYLFLKRFLAIQHASALKNIPIKYVMTDLAERNLAYWRKHPLLQPFIEQDALDFACFDVEHDRELKLTHSGETISAKNLRNPLVVIANYVFDSIPQDAFLVSDGQLYEALVSLTPQEKEQPDDQGIPVELSYECDQVNGNYYEDAQWNRILLDYKRRLPNTSFLFPTAALECIQNLHCLSRGRMLLLSGDRGYSSDEGLLAGNGEPIMTLHGSISMMVDYQIIGDYCEHLGGQVLHPARRAESLNVSAFLLGKSPGDFAETRQAYAEAIEKFGPDDFFILKEGVAHVYDALTPDQILAFLRLSGWDYKRFYECLPALKKHLPAMTAVQTRQLHEAIVNVWDSYMPIGEESDLAFELGTLLVEIESHQEALEFLQRSVDLYGMAPGTAYNIAICYYALSQLDQARDHVNQALSLDPQFAEAKTLLAELESSLSNTTRKVRRRRRA